MVVVVIVSMGLLVTVLAVGIVRLRAAAGNEQSDDPELELGWEGGEGGGEGPNITVNPLEVRIEIIQLLFSNNKLADRDNQILGSFINFKEC